MLQFILYQSTPLYAFGSQHDKKILEKSRLFNKRKEITGFLMRSRLHFFQFLEGPDFEVNRLVKKIQKDPRHTHFKILKMNISNERQFPTWSMGYHLISEPERVQFEKFLQEEDTFGTAIIEYMKSAQLKEN